MAIDVGNAATVRAWTVGCSNITVIDKNNPANASGTISQIEVYVAYNITGAIFGFFSGSGTSYTYRSSTSVGNVSQGSKTTFTGLSLSIQSGDFIAYYHGTNGSIYGDGFVGANQYQYTGNAFSSGTYTFTNSGYSYTWSMYGIGSEAASGQPAVKRLGGVPFCSINRGVW